MARGGAWCELGRLSKEDSKNAFEQICAHKFCGNSVIVSMNWPFFQASIVSTAFVYTNFVCICFWVDSWAESA